MADATILGEQPAPVRAIRSENTAEAALRELAWHNANVTAINADAEAAHRQIDENAANARKASEARIEVLESRLLAYGEAEREPLCTSTPGGEKTAQLTAGTFTWRASSERVAMLDGWNAKQCAAHAAELPVGQVTIDDSEQLLPALRKILESAGYGAVLTVSLGVDRKAALAAHKSTSLDANELAAIGLEYVPADEFVSVEASQYVREGA